MTCHLCQGNVFQWQIKCVRDDLQRDAGELAARAECRSLILSCEGTLRRNCTSSCMCKCENILISLFTFSSDNTEALFTFFSSVLGQRMKHMQPSPCLSARCFVLFSLHCNYLVFPNVNAAFLCFVYKTRTK